MKLEVQGLNNAYNDTVTIDNGVATGKSYTTLILVNQLITNATLIATYMGGITRSSDLIDFIGK